MKFFSFLILVYLFCLNPTYSAESKRVITAEQWAVPRSAETLIAMPALRETINEMQTFPGNRLLIRHPGGEEGVLWVSELRSWLVSLGISSQSIELVPGSEQNIIELSVIHAAYDTDKSISENGGSE